MPPPVAVGARVTVVCRPRLHALLRPVTAGARVVEGLRAGEAFDVQIPFTSLAFVFSTVRGTIPAAGPSSPPGPTGSRPGRSGSAARTHGVRIGLCWRGSQDWRADPRRSVRPDLLAPLATPPGVRLISLQVATEDGDAALPLEWLDGVGAGHDAFIGTAAIMANLDLVISCDTFIAHLAGALGRPTFVLLHAVPEWRWLKEGDETPWYPRLCLVRQRAGEGWHGAVERLVVAVRDRVE